MKKISWIFAGVLLATVNGLGAVAQAEDKGEVRLLTYEGYADKDWVEEFTKETGIAVKVTYVGGVDEQIAKMKASEGRDYDVVAVDTASMKAYVDQKLLAALDLDKLTSKDNLLPAFKPMSNTTFDGKTYGVPFAWGSLGLVYDKKTFPVPPDSWAVMLDPKFKGKVTSLDDANNNVNFAAISLGIADPFNLTEDQFKAVKQRLVDVKANLLTYYAGFDEGNKIWAENDVALMFSMGELAEVSLNKQGSDVGYVIPKEGAVGWLDNMTISAGSPHPETAYAWINFVVQKKIGIDMNTKSGYGSTVAEVSGMDYASRLKWAVTPENYTRRQQLWNEVKAGVQ